MEEFRGEILSVEGMQRHKDSILVGILTLQ